MGRPTLAGPFIFRVIAPHAADRNPTGAPIPRLKRRAVDMPHATRGLRSLVGRGPGTRSFSFFFFSIFSFLFWFCFFKI
jgi:hypothetical protein